MNTRHILLSAFAALCLQAYADANAAAVYCAGSASQILSAFDSANADVEGSTQDIRIRTGSYSLAESLSFFPPGNKDSKTFSLTGGWNSDCTSRTTNPANTVLNFTSFNSDGRGVEMRGDNYIYTVEGIRFEHVALFEIYEPACGAFQICSDTEAINVRFNEFRDGNKFNIQSQDARTLTVRNNLFDGFSGSYGENLLTVEYINSESAPNVSFNTFADMHCGGGTTALMRFYTQITTTLHHNIFDQSGCTYDLTVPLVTNAKAVTLRNNLYGTLGGIAPTATSGNLINVDPGFIDPVNNNFNLRATAPKSAAIDAGMTLNELVNFSLSMPSQDLDGPYGGRLVGSRLDLGALESPGAPPSGFVVTTTNDSGTGSLRDAITQANLAAGHQKISFAIAGICPRRILLDSLLPDITDDLEIDGYTEAGSNPNSAQIGSNAKLCVVVGPTTGSSLAHAFRVPDGQSAGLTLTVRGIAFAGNHTVALNLRSGSGHVVQGNAFGGVRPGGFDVLGSNISHLGIRGDAQNVLVGGPDPEDRNTFGSSVLNAVLLVDATSGGHVVQNNYIGLDPTGSASQAIDGNAISAQASDSIQIQDNVIASSSSGIRISGATATGYIIKGNTFGLDAYGAMSAALENTYGILVTGGSGGHIIGSHTGTARSNIVANSTGAGIWIDATAGAGTVVRPNSIYGNGKSGLGLGIDLGALGPLPNDPLDQDSGPNQGQNAPLISASTPNANGTRQVVGRLVSVPSTAFLIDIYRSPTCASANRGGDAKTRIGSIDITTSNSAGGGVATFSLSLSGNDAPAFLTAIAKRTVAGDSSEIGPCFNEDTILKNGFEESGF